MARRVSAARVKSNRCYTVEEAAETVGVTQQTIRAWIKQGLHAMCSQRPALIRGIDLKDYVKQQRKPKAGPLDIGFFYCMGCKQARRPALGIVDYLPISEKHGRLVAFCSTCEGGCSRIVGTASLSAWVDTCQLGGSIPQHAYKDPTNATEAITSEVKRCYAEV